MNNKRIENIKVSFLGALKSNISIIIAFAIIFIASSIASPKFCTVNNLIAVLRTAAPNSICAFAMALVIMTGGIDLSVGSFMSLCGCLCTVLIAWADFPVWSAVTLSLLLGAIYGCANGLIITKLKMPPFIVTLAALNILRGVSYLITNGRPVILPDDRFQGFGGGFWGAIPRPVYYMIALFIVFWFFLNRTRFGRHIYAVGGNITAARFSGINSDWVIIRTYILSGFMSALSGIILSSRLNSGQPTIGDGAELDAIAACVVGGISMTGGSGTMFGALLGALTITIISNVLNLVGLNSFAQLVVKGIIILVAVYVDALRKTRKRR